MKNLLFILITLILLPSCANNKQTLEINTSQLREVEIMQIDTESHILSFYIIVQNNENQTIKTDALGVEIFANGLKIGENYCKLNSTLTNNSTQEIPVSVAFKISDLGTKETSLPKNLQLNIQGQLKLLMNEKEYRTLINNSYKFD